MPASKKKKGNIINSKRVDENIDGEASKKSEIDSIDDSDNTYIIVVSDGNDDNVNINDVKNEVNFGHKEVELAFEATSNNNLMCRFCMSTYDNLSTNLMPLFNSSTRLKFISVNVLSALESLTGLKILEDEDLPKYICKMCLSRLEICWAFRQQCLKSDKSIRDLQQASKQFCEMSNSALTSKISSEIGPKNHMEDSEIKEEENKSTSLHGENNLDKGDNSLEKRSLKLKSLDNSKSSNESIKNKRKAKMCLSSSKSKVLKTKIEYDVNVSSKSDGEKVASCNICDNEENSIEDVNKHLRIMHFEEYPYFCDICDKVFKTENLLSFHVKTVHKIRPPHFDRPIKCSVCSLEVPKNVLADHFLKHRTENVLKEHNPVLHHGPLLRCSYCWEVGEPTAQRMTQYYCPDCQKNLCFAPCFEEYHKNKDAEIKNFDTVNLSREEKELDSTSAVPLSCVEEPGE